MACTSIGLNIFRVEIFITNIIQYFEGYFLTFIKSHERNNFYSENFDLVQREFLQREFFLR